MVVSLNGEIWKPFPEWEALYGISNKGSVKSFERKVLIKGGGMASIIEAEEDGHETNAIRQAIINEWTHKGYNWKYLDGKTVTRKKRVNRKVGCFVDAELQQEYQDINKVVENGYDRRNIYRSLRDGKTTVKGFLWKYLD